MHTHVVPFVEMLACRSFCFSAHVQSLLLQWASAEPFVTTCTCRALCYNALVQSLLLQRARAEPAAIAAPWDGAGAHTPGQYSCKGAWGSPVRSAPYGRATAQGQQCRAGWLRTARCALFSVMARTGRWRVALIWWGLRPPQGSRAAEAPAPGAARWVLEVVSLGGCLQLDCGSSQLVSTLTLLALCGTYESPWGPLVVHASHASSWGL